MTIREIDLVRDGEQAVALVIETSPFGVTNTEEWTHRRRSMPARARSLTQVAVVDGRIVGLVDASLDFFGSGDLGRLGVRVAPAFRRRGIGSALYDSGLAHIATLGARQAAAAFEESEEGVAFATARGWREARGESLSSLDPTTVTEAPDPALDIRPARELDPRELHAVDEEATRDMPSLEELEAIPYDEWRAFVWDNPLFSREGSFGVVVDGRVASLSLIRASLEAARAFSMFTGTLRPYRGRGLALAVKLASIRWAAANGITQLVTTNDETNAPMLAVNRRLGYRPAGRRVEYVLDLTPASDSSQTRL
jgi:GNAT superfamily N-acetyltransferase